MLKCCKFSSNKINEPFICFSALNNKLNPRLKKYSFLKMLNCNLGLYISTPIHGFQLHGYQAFYMYPMHISILIPRLVEEEKQKDQILNFLKLTNLINK